MNIRSRRPRRTRRPRRRYARRLRRTAYSGSNLANKVFSYVMSPASQYITNTNALGGLSVPIASANSVLQLTNCSAPIASLSGFQYFYDFGVSMSFKLSNLQNFAAFCNLYDNWRISYITLTITCMSNTAATAGTSLMPTLYYFVDQDDAQTPTTGNVVTSRQGYKTHHFGMKQTCTIRIKPRPAALLLNTSSGSAQASQGKYKTWMDCQYRGYETDLFGLKMWFQDVWLANNTVNPGGNTGLKFDYRYNVQFKCPINES